MNELTNSHGSGSRGSGNHEVADQSDAKARDWRKSMSDHVAYALLVYTGLQIFMTVKALGEGTSSLLPYVALVILVAAIIPACRWFERRWTGMSDEEAADEAHAGAFRRDTVMLWVLAIGLPLALTGLCKAIFAVI
ncbi:hypothetical protein [uncultured Erythrobacter sp.]|uniref:hypothetical protein n=1 Tax=uncultured Erythrobacter sp. TaxID=263913 RepID=UPI002618697F|nr:hypothetical protein [uncultured Erythrobacter sp.]